VKLIQDKLDVKNKTRVNIFNWRGQFTPDFVDYILESFAHPDDVFVEPFSGSGTVLLECARRDFSCYGFEINPAAYAMSKFFTFTNVPQEIRLDIASSLKEKILSLIQKFHGLPLFSEHESFREGYKNLLEFSKVLFSKIDSPQERILALNTLFIAENHNKGDLNSSVMKSFNYINTNLIHLPFTKKVVSAQLGDARLIHKNCPAKANIIFTSPPYINVFNYHQNYRAILETLGWNILKVAQSEFGSNRKNRGNRFRTVIQYCLDMEQTLKSFWECLDKDGLIILVIGRESNVRKIPFYNGEIVKELANETGCFKDISNFERKFINRFGINLKEDIVTLRKDSAPPSFSKAKEIALKHLESALGLASQEVKEDLLDAISGIDTVHPSPLFITKGVFSND
jgi:DNA modification methylase